MHIKIKCFAVKSDYLVKFFVPSALSNLSSFYIQTSLLLLQFIFKTGHENS
jgi:hypothetical protein